MGDVRLVGRVEEDPVVNIVSCRVLMGKQRDEIREFFSKF